MDGAWRMIAVALTAAALAGAGAWRMGEDEARQESAAAAAVVIAAAQSRIDRAEADVASLRLAKADAEARLAQASDRTRRGWCMARFERARAEALAAKAEAPTDRRAFVEACLGARAGGNPVTD